MSFLGGALAVYLVAVLVYLVWHLAGGVDRNGYWALAFAFKYGPVLALVGGLAAMILLRKRLH